MKKIFLILIMVLSSYGFSTERYSGHTTYLTAYQVCSGKNLTRVIDCVNNYIQNSGYRAQSGLHGVQTPQGTLFFQALIKN